MDATKKILGNELFKKSAPINASIISNRVKMFRVNPYHQTVGLVMSYYQVLYHQTVLTLPLPLPNFMAAQLGFQILAF